MQVWASVNEADIGNIHPASGDVHGGRVPRPDRSRAWSTRFGSTPTMTQNVVTYTVEVTTDNSNGMLLPYLTANVQFEVEEHKDVLVVPERRPAVDADAVASRPRARCGGGIG